MRELSCVELQFGEDGRACIIAFEFADLPLACEHPERIANFGLERAIEIGRARAALQTIPRRDGGEQALADDL